MILFFDAHLIEEQSKVRERVVESSEERKRKRFLELGAVNKLELTLLEPPSVAPFASSTGSKLDFKKDEGPSPQGVEVTFPPPSEQGKDGKGRRREGGARNPFRESEEGQSRADQDRPALIEV